MRVIARWARLVGLAALFAAGWGAGALVHDARLAGGARPDPPDVGALTASASAADADKTCSDPLAMQANANLVSQLRDHERRLALAEARAHEAESKVARAATAAAGARLATPSEEWARMAREGTIRLRVPCSSWDAGGQFSVRRAALGRTMRMATGSRRYEIRQRADAARLSDEELETLAEVYRRVHSQTWAAMRASCEANADFRESMAEAEGPSDETRVATCRSAMLDVTTASGRMAIANVARLRAVGARSDRAREGAERVMFALTHAAQALDDEMTRSFGQERAKRAIGNGVVCFDETLFDLRGGDGSGGSDG